MTDSANKIMSGLRAGLDLLKHPKALRSTNDARADESIDLKEAFESVQLVEYSSNGAVEAGRNLKSQV